MAGLVGPGGDWEVRREGVAADVTVGLVDGPDPEDVVLVEPNVLSKVKFGPQRESTVEVVHRLTGVPQHK